MRFLMAAFVLLLPLSVNAQSSSDGLCHFSEERDWDVIADAFTGTWIMSHKAGFVLMPTGMVLPFNAAGQNDPIDVAMIDDTLVMIPPNGAPSVELDWADEPAWQFRADVGIAEPEPLLTDSDIEALMGCKLADIPRLIGRTTVEGGGQSINLTYRFMVTGADTMYAIMHAFADTDNGPVNTWRSVTMIR